MRYDNLILRLFLEDDWHFKRSVYNKFCFYKDRKYPNIYNYLMFERFSDTQSIKESIYRINFKINERPVCKACGNPVVFVGKCGILFRDFCTVKCAQSNKEVQLKKAETDKSHHNGKRGWNCCNYKDPVRIENWRKNVLEKYGNFKKATNIEKRRKTCLLKYGCDNPMKNKQVKNKYKQTVLNSYGVDNPLKSSIVQQKRNKTLKKNYKYATSKQEDIVYDLLLEIYPDIIFHYTSDDYPWNCDFYVPSQDLYIEFHGSHYHNDHPYLGTEEDLKYVEKLKESSKIIKERTGRKKSQYDIMIYTWTDLDVRKRNHCQENNINYLEFYSLKEVEEYIRKKKENL